MSHYYIAHPDKLKLVLDEYCADAKLPAEKAEFVKRTVQDVLDSPEAIKHHVRIEVPDPVLPTASVTGNTSEQP